MRAKLLLFCQNLTVNEEPIKLAALEREKNFIKLLKKNKKEVDSLQRKHSKELQAVQKAQCLAIEKLTKGKRCVVFL